MPTGPVTVATGAGTLCLAATLVGGIFVYDMGAVSVRVKGKKPGGDNIRLVLPAAVAPVGVWLAPKEKLREVEEKAGPYLPALAIAAAELERMPDFTLLEVTSPREKVRIHKKSGHLVIDVDDANETVHVSVPLKAARVVAAQLASQSREETSKASPEVL